MLEVRDGHAIAIATPEAVTGDDLHRLEAEVLDKFRRQLVEEQVARTDAQRLYLAAIRQIARFLRAERAPTMPITPTLDPGDGFAP
jgi:F-type H+-transporting ATPase subunit epsilon